MAVEPTRHNRVPVASLSGHRARGPGRARSRWWRLVATDNAAVRRATTTPTAPAARCGAHVDRFDGARPSGLLRAGGAGPAAGGLAGVAPARASSSSARAERALPGGARRPAQRDRRRCPAREPGTIVVGAHYDTKDIPGFVGANDGASGTAVGARARARARAAARCGPRSASSSSTARRRRAATPDAEFERDGLRGSKVRGAASIAMRAAMVLLDFVGDSELAIPREAQLGRGPVGAAARGGPAGRARRASSPTRPGRRRSTTTSRSSSRACRRST